MNHFNPQWWGQVLGDFLVLGVYFAGPLFIFCSGATFRDDDAGDVDVSPLCLLLGIVLVILAHMITAGVIK